MMKRKLLLLFCFLLLPDFSSADVQTTIIQVQGFGVTHGEAVQNGLIEALKQTRGVTIDSQKTFAKRIRQENLSKDGQTSHQVQVSAQSQKLVREVTQGLIHGYEIMDSKNNGDGEWEVALSVKMVQYKTPGISPDNRRKIAIIPFRINRLAFNFCAKPISGAELSTMFAQKLVTQFTQTRKFTVLDREYSQEFLREKNLILSPDAPVAEQMKIGEVLGVDYLVVGTILDAGSRIEEYTIRLTNERGWDRSALFVAEYRIIVMATRQIKWSDSVRIILGNDDFQSLGMDSPEMMQQAVLDKAADDLVSRAMENIYPIQVAEILPDGQLILNQGGKGLQEGLMLDIFKKGKKIRDPYTGEVLGFSETLVGSAQVVKVTAKTSYARIVEGHPGDVSRGNICRRTKEEEIEQEIPGRATDVIIPDQGGVVLPFD